MKVGCWFLKECHGIVRSSHWQLGVILLASGTGKKFWRYPFALLRGQHANCQHDTDRRQRGAIQKQVPISVLKAAVLHEWISQQNRQTWIQLKTNDVSWNNKSADIIWGTTTTSTMGKQWWMRNGTQMHYKLCIPASIPCKKSCSAHHSRGYRHPQYWILQLCCLLEIFMRNTFAMLLNCLNWISLCSAVISFRNTHENTVCNFLLEPPMGSKISQAGSMHISAAILILTERGITNSYVINISQTSPLRGRPHKISTKVFLNYESVCMYM